MKPIAYLVVLVVVAAALYAVKWGLSPPERPTEIADRGGALPAPVAQPQQAEALALDDRMSSLLRATGERPSVADVQLATPKDLSRVLSVYQNTGDLLAQRNLLWTLSYHGYGAAESAFRANLRRDYANVISRQEEAVLHDTILSIGLLADQSTGAFEYLRDGTDPEFWRQSAKWKSPRGEHSIAMCVSFSIHGIGASGRAEVPQVLGELRQRNRRYLHQFAGDITQAAYYLYLRETKGTEAFKRGFLSGVSDCDHSSLFDQWSTGAGKAWFDWANDCMRGPRPTETGN